MKSNVRRRLNKFKFRYKYGTHWFWITKLFSKNKKSIKSDLLNALDAIKETDETLNDDPEYKRLVEKIMKDDSSADNEMDTIICHSCKKEFIPSGVQYYCDECTKRIKEKVEKTGERDLLLECQKLGIINIAI